MEQLLEFNVLYTAKAATLGMSKVPAIQALSFLPDLDEHKNAIEALIAAESGELVALLQGIQQHFGWLPHNVLSHVGDRIGVPLSQIWGVATFYASFHVRPRGRTVIRVCHGTACHVRGAARVSDAITGHLGISATGDTTADLRYSVDRVGCIGCCSLAPVVSIGEEIYARLDRAGAVQALERHEASAISSRRHPDDEGGQ